MKENAPAAAAKAGLDWYRVEKCIEFYGDELHRKHGEHTHEQTELWVCDVYIQISFLSF